nr:TRAP transporter small permease [Sneathiella chinensis]
MSVDVLCKYLFNMPLIWTMDVVVSYMMVAIVFLPLAEVEKQNGHICVELFTQTLGPMWRRGVEIFATVVATVYFMALTWRSWGDAVNKFHVGEYVMGEAQVTIWPGRFFVPLGCGMLVLLLLYKIYRLLTDKDALETEQGALHGGHFDE